MHSSCKRGSFAQGNEKKRLTWLQSHNVCHAAGKSLSLRLFPELQLELSMGVSVQRGVLLTMNEVLRTHFATIVVVVAGASVSVGS